MTITLKKIKKDAYEVEGVVIPPSTRIFTCPIGQDIIKTFKISYQKILNTSNYDILIS